MVQRTLNHSSIATTVESTEVYIMDTLTSRTRRLITLCSLLVLIAIPAVVVGHPLTSGAAAPRATSAPGSDQHSLAELLNPDGTLRTDTGFSGSLNTAGWTMSTVNGAPRFTPTAQAAGDAQWDNSFGAVGVRGTVTAIAVDSQGGIYVGGGFSRVGGMDASGIAYWDGHGWHALGAGLNWGPNQILLGNGKLYVMGRGLDQAGSAVVNQIAQWDGSAWSAVSSGVGPRLRTSPGSLSAMALSGSDLYVGGSFDHIDGVAANSIARWDGTAWHALDAGIMDSNHFAATVYAITPVGTSLYVGGEFSIAGTLATSNIAHWDGTSWRTLGAGVSGKVNKIAARGTTVYVGGRFTTADGLAANSIAQWDGAMWHVLGVGLGPTTSGLANVLDLAISGDNLYVAGGFSSAGGQPMPGFARWDGSAWSPIGEVAGVSGISTLAITPAGGLLAGGSFETLPGISASNIALWDGTSWQALGRGLQDGFSSAGTLYAIAIDTAGHVYVGGAFQCAGGVPASNIAMWDGSRWSSLGADNNGAVKALIVAGDSIYAAGDFTTMGTLVVNHIAKWSPSTKQWSALGNGINGSVYALAYADGTLYAGGNFTAAGAVLAQDLVYWDGSQWHPFGKEFEIFQIEDWLYIEIDTYVYALAVSGNTVYVGGKFRTMRKVGENPELQTSYLEVNNIAAWDRSSDTWSFVGAPTATTKAGLVLSVPSPYYSGYVNALLLSGSNLYIGGAFTQAGSVLAAYLVRRNLSSGTWENIGDIAIANDSHYGQVRSLAMADKDLYVGGTFTAAGPTTARFVARLDTASGAWSSLGSGMKGRLDDNYTYVNSIAASSNGIYFGGTLEYAGDIPSYGIARWNAPGAEGSIGAAGGTLSDPDGTSLIFPAGALAADSSVSYSAQFFTTHPAPSDQAIIRSFQFAAVGADGNPITTFVNPYTLRVPYTDAQMATLGISDPTKLNVAYWDGTAWKAMLPCEGCSVDPATKTVIVVANHFTEFALVGPGPKKVYLPLITR